jgi:DNA segregation ATPase FtsK/SpoIIIE-like protein
MTIRVFVTGGTFDKEYNELDGTLYFKDSHLAEMLRLGRCRLDLAVRTLMMVDSVDMTDDYDDWKYSETAILDHEGNPVAVPQRNLYTSAFIDTPEIEKLTDFIGSQRAYPDAYHLPEFADDQDEPITDFDPEEKDALFEDAARIIVQNQQGSTSLLQRKMKIGYNRAGRIIDQLEAAGIVGPFEGSKAREVLIHNEIELEQFLRNMEE